MEYCVMAIVTASSFLGGGVKSSQRGVTAVPGTTGATFTITLPTSVSSGKYQLTIFNNLNYISAYNVTTSISGTSLTFNQGAANISWQTIFSSYSQSGTLLHWELTEFY